MLSKHIVNLRYTKIYDSFSCNANIWPYLSAFLHLINTMKSCAQTKEVPYCVVLKISHDRTAEY